MVRVIIIPIKTATITSPPPNSHFIISESELVKPKLVAAPKTCPLAVLEGTGEKLVDDGEGELVGEEVGVALEVGLGESEGLGEAVALADGEGEFDACCAYITAKPGEKIII